MAQTKYINTRIQMKRDTAANWESKNPVLLNGEIIIVDTSNGEVRFKIGNGSKTYTQLPFEDETVRNLIAGKADTSAVPTKYAGSDSAGGAATSANKLNTNAGSATNPVYFANGIPVKTTYTLGKSVPSDAKFTDTTYSAATTSAAGLMSAADKSKLDGIATGANNYTYTLPTATDSALGGVKVGSNITNSSGTISITKDNVTAALGYTPPTTNTTYNAATQSAQGLMSAADKTKLDGVATGAEVNQNAFANIKVGSTTIAADAKQDTLTLTAGTNITLTPDATNDGVTITAKDTTYSAATTSAAGLMSASDKTKLDGIASGANAYSLPAAGSSLGGVKTGGDVTISAGVITVNDDSHAHIISNVDGLQTALDAKAPLASPALTGTPTAPTASAATNNTQIATTAFVNTVVNNKIAAADAMIYKGTIGSSGATITALPATHSTGWTYKVLTAGTYAGVKCEIGDMIICLTDGTSASDSHWTVIQNNIDGAVTGPTSAVDARVAVFNGTSGKVIKDSGYTIASSVPANAKFTDTTYSAATTSANGLMTAAMVTKLNGIATGANAYTLPTAGSSLGGVKTTSTVTSTSGYTPTPIIDGVPYYKDTNTTYSLSSFGITATATELNYTDGVTSNIQTQLNAKAPTNHASTGTSYGVSTASAYGHAMASSTTPKANGTAAVGSETAKFARGDHVHPLQTTVSGNAGTATKLATARTIALTGSVTGSGSFDGSGNLSIATTTNHNHDSTYVNVTGDTMTGQLQVNAPIFGYNYSKNNDAPAFVFDKPGSNYTGIGAHGTDTIYFGAVNSSGFTWNTSYKQKWLFNGGVTADTVNVASAVTLAYDSTNKCLNFNFA